MDEPLARARHRRPEGDARSGAGDQRSGAHGGDRSRGLAGQAVIISDDAGQFRVGDHALCWVHAERLVHKLVPANDKQSNAVKVAKGMIWWFYRRLKAYKRAPSAQQASLLRVQFNRIFKRRTGYATLDRLLKRLLGRKDELLRVLERAEIPLNTNASENDIRAFVTKRKISGGTVSEKGRQARDAMLGLAKTCRKLKIPFFDYLAPVSASLAPTSPTSRPSSAPPQADQPPQNLPRLQGVAVSCCMRNGFVGVGKREFRHLELAQIQKAGPDERGQADVGLPRVHPLAAYGDAVPHDPRIWYGQIVAAQHSDPSHQHDPPELPDGHSRRPHRLRPGGRGQKIEHAVDRAGRGMPDPLLIRLLVPRQLDRSNAPSEPALEVLKHRLVAARRRRRSRRPSRARPRRRRRRNSPWRR